MPTSRPMLVSFRLAPAKRWPWFCNCLFGLVGEPALDFHYPRPSQNGARACTAMTPGLTGFSKVASGQLRVNRGHACWPDDFRSDDASVLLLPIASCDFVPQDQRPWRAHLA